MEFDYPIDYSLYSPEEISIIINFLDTIEECYTKGVELEKYKIKYKEFKSVVRAKSEENNLYKNFKEITGYDGYLTTKEMRTEKSTIKL
ncbi:UPF0223 family protein [Gemella cuniculi]|uniref:UPF0223 family protein n=1 Tax=Gemella cuniculi TaxID=150240 RepID=UPI00041DDF94|nr:UPF0223 family protein [Gemella cuniculi]